MTPNLHRRRAGFTLVELLTVMFIISVLAAIAVSVARSSIADSYKTVGGADRLSGWLIIAKNRALRDRVPVGLRLIRDPNNPNVAREAQYIEMPVLWAPNQIPDGYVLSQVQNPSPPFLVVKYDQGIGGLRQEDGVQSAASQYGVFVFGLNVLAFDVKVGDLLSLADFGTVHRIEAITQLSQAPTWYPLGYPSNLYPPVNATFPCFKITLAQSLIPLRANEQYPPSPPNPPMLLPSGVGAAPAPGNSGLYPVDYPPLGAANFYRTFFFGFYRSARPILGEPIVTLPTNMVVDMTPDTPANAPNPYPVYRNPSVGLPALASIPANPDLQFVDIIFAPSGQVMFTDSGLVCFWLRNETKPPPEKTSADGTLFTTLGGTPLREIKAPATVAGTTYRYFDRERMLATGDHVIVAVYTKTGAISSYSAFMPDLTNQYNLNLNEDMYKFVRDAFNRGF
ncbi:MAG TPA: prepilin-type N-terminal cleavage/methylation domain-containing protein [Fimbriiglobus sp.]|jgi:prepilin-type N-terminal cleavage/methylation domain-containing protein